ncbi:MAG: hypothetical protein J0M00_15330 [Burkholderiales bacterium]|nr:hypothetical protein [Burkholderiales bacterium]
MPTAAPPIGHEELLQALNELLEAERAGARVARETAAGMPAAPLKSLVEEIQADEVRWCKMLIGHIGALQGEASTATGAFHAKAMAIPELGERLAFLNRGQAWVVRRLQGLIPRLDNRALQADLQAMLAAHGENIARVDQRLAA